MAPKLPVAKSSTYFALLEAFGKGGCPVCGLMQRSSTAYLETLFYEQVTDVGTRRKLRQTRGFCTWHMWEARNIKAAPLGVAIIAQDLLEEELTRLSALQRHPIGPFVANLSSHKMSLHALIAFLRAWRQRGMCPACQVAVEHERHGLETLLASWLEGHFAERFDASGGLCLPHVVRMIEQHASHPALNALIEAQRRKYARLVAELEEFSRKHNYRFADSLWGAESDSWLRAIEMMAGKPGVYGTDLHRHPSARGPQRWWQRLIDRISRAWDGC
jgi:hypothetical protein